MNPQDFHVDLTNCDREPIHTPGAIQPHGMLFVCEGSDLRITRASSNVEAELGLSGFPLGRRLTSLLSDDSARRLSVAAESESFIEHNPLSVDSSDGRAWFAILHRPENQESSLIVEMEPRSPQGPGFHQGLRAAVRKLQTAHDTLSLCKIAADEVRAITGFDRVMVYRFDASWNGEVVAEAKRDDLEPFLGLHYPASDIPAQARRLYTVNWLRFIADIEYKPAPLLPPTAAGQEPLDLSFSVLRSVSPIHVEYLYNMGVRASMSISLLRDGKLWGLIACHHYAGAKVVPFPVRETSEHLGQMLSWHVAAREQARESAEAAVVHRLEAKLVHEMSVSSNFFDGLCSDTLVELARAGGACFVYDGRILHVGETPGDAAVQALVEWLRSVPDDNAYSTSDLSSAFPPARAWTEAAAGLLSVPISRDLGDYLLWFRPAVTRTVDWAGEPKKLEIQQGDGPPRLSPRGSFALWRETVKGTSLPWEPEVVTAATNLRRGVLEGVRKREAELKNFNARLVAADKAKDVFIATVSHELRTPLNAISGWAQLLRGRTLTPERLDHALDVIVRNVRTQTQLVEDLIDVSRMASGELTIEQRRVDLESVLDAAVGAHVLSAEAKRIRLLLDVASPLPLLRGDASRLQQVFSNLLSNAVKFTPEGGHIDVRAERNANQVSIAVEDSGRGIDAAFLPHVFELFRIQDDGTTREHRGLGLGLGLVRHLVEIHGGTVSAHSEGAGRGTCMRVRLPVPIESLESSSQPQSPAKLPARVLLGVRAVVVDDEPDSRELLQAVLEDVGAEVRLCSSAEAALQAVESWRPDVLVSDVAMPEMDGFELMRRVRALPPTRGGSTPAVAVTAFARSEDAQAAVNAGFYRHLPKPVNAAELVAAVRAATQVAFVDEGDASP